MIRVADGCQCSSTTLREDQAMQWQEVCEHPDLHDLPFKIELNEHGKIVMTPVKVAHSALQGEIEFILRTQLPGGKTLPECAISTPKGTKVADVAWVSLTLFERIKGETECSVAPEICVEVVSKGNTEKEMEEKKALYLCAGAVEIWTCDETGNMRFFDRSGELGRSKLAPEFPIHVEL